MTTINKKLSELKPDPRNTRLHDRRNLDLIKESLKEFGQYRPFVVDQNLIIRVGNGMYAAMLELGWTEGQCTILHLTPEQAMALSIVDNRVAELSKWDDVKLAQVMEQLDDRKASVGFDEEELSKILQQTVLEPINLSDDDEEAHLTKCVHCGFKWREK